MDRPPPSGDAPKATWRAWARGVRAATVDDALSSRVAAALAAWPPFGRAAHVLAYLPFGTEVDLGDLDDLGARFARGARGRPARPRKIYVPRTNASGRLSLHPLERDALVRHRHGFLEPPADAEEVGADVVDLVLVPGLAFDEGGGRLGYGGGFYDRLLGAFDAGVPLVGVSVEALVVARLPREVHDLPVTHLLTERGVRPAARPPAP